MKNEYLWERLKEYNGVLIYGIGNGADMILDICESIGIRCLAVFASKGYKTGQHFRGHIVMPFEDALNMFPEAPILLSFAVFQPELLDEIEKLSKKRLVFAPDVPVIGDEIVTPEQIELRKIEIEKLLTVLADKESVDCFKAVLRFKLSGEPKYLRHIECDRRTVINKLFSIPQNAVYIDGGAYRGDTFEEYISLFGKPKEAWLFEPADVNFRKLSEKYSECPECRLINEALSDFSGEIGLSSRSGRGAHIGGNIPARATAIDSIFLDKKVDYIKLDVEGEEAAVIKGAERTIKRCRPYLSVSAYHRTWDFIDIGLILEKIGGYKIYLRHHPYIPAWETIYYAVPEKEF